MNDSELLDALTRLLDAIRDADNQRRMLPGHKQPDEAAYREFLAVPTTLWDAVLDAAQDARRVSF